MGNHELRHHLMPGGRFRMRFLASIESRPAWDVEVDVLLTGSGPVVQQLTVRRHLAHNGLLEILTPGEDPRANGITTRLMREINVGELTEIARAEARTQAAQIATFLNTSDQEANHDLSARLEVMSLFATARKRSGRRGNGIAHYLRWADRYVRACDAGVRNPNAVLAREWGEKPEYVRDTVTDARRRYGLLTASRGRGLAGGSLTPKALELVASGILDEDK